MKNKFILLISTFITLSLSSCFTTKPGQYVVDTSCPEYKRAGFDRQDISRGIGVLPVVIGNDKEKFRRPMGDVITNSLGTEIGHHNVSSPEKVVGALKQNNLSREYSEAINNYNSTGVVPDDIVGVLGQSLSTDYLLYTRLLSDYEKEVRGGGDRSIRVRKVKETYLQCQIWDTRTGNIVWEGKAGVAEYMSNREVMTENELIEKTANGLLKVLAKDIADEPCMTKDDWQPPVVEVNPAGCGLTVATAAILSGLIIYLSISGP